MNNGMHIKSTPEARSMILERGGLLFVRLSRVASVRGAMRRLLVTTEPPPDALEYRRYETKGFLLFLHPGVRPPKELHVEVVGWLSRRVEAFWNGCAFVF
ncbi:MAG: hypothetical protein ACRDHU_15625 [Actinomycetota bacterium]